MGNTPQPVPQGPYPTTGGTAGETYGGSYPSPHYGEVRIPPRTPGSGSHTPGEVEYDENGNAVGTWILDANGQLVLGPVATPNLSFTTGSSGYGGGGGGSSGPTAQQIKIAEDAARAGFREVLRRWGIPASKNMLNMIEKAVKQGWNSTLFVDHLRHTPDYHAKFPGLRFGQGMSEAAYNSQYTQYRQLARSIGENFDRKTFARALKHNVTPDLFQARIEAIKSIEQWGPMMEGFKEALAANGYVKRAEDVSKASLTKMVMGLGEKAWEELWDETVVTTNLERVAGITVGAPPKGWGDSPGGGSPFTENIDNDFMKLTREDMLTVIKQVESLTPGFKASSISSPQWRDMGARMRKFKGSFLAKYGLTAKDLLEMELGGPRAAAIAAKSEKILAEQDAVFEQRATPMSAQNVGSQKASYNELPQQV